MFSVKSFAYDALRSTKLVAKSSTGKTLRFDIGIMHGLNVEDTCELSSRSGPVARPSYDFVGSGKLVKVFQNYSYWYFPVIKSESLKVGDVYQMHVRKNVYHGRDDVPIKYKVTSASSNRAVNDRKNGFRGDFPKSLEAENDLLEVESIVSDSEDVDDSTINIQKKRNIQEVTPLIINGRSKKTYSVDTYIKDNTDKINYGLKEQIAKDQNLNQIKKINSNEFGYNQLYQDLGYKTEEDFTYMSNNEFDEYVKSKEYQEDIPESVKKMIQKEGQMWSAQMDDKELSNFIKRTGVNRERLRRSNAYLSEAAHEFTLYIGANLSSNTTSTDQNYQSPGNTSGVLYEYHLQKVDQSYRAWSFDGLLERSIVNYDVGGSNARLTYSSVGGHLNYYFYNYPTSKKVFAFFIGAGLKYGVGELDSINISKTYKFDLLSLPSAHIGVKYRIPANYDYQRDLNIGFGFLGKVTTESLKISSVDDISDSINANQNLSNLRFEFGVSFYF